jgi:hypothetical protein
MAPPRTAFRAFPFVVAAAVSASLILAAPFIGEIRRAILARFPGQFVRIVGAIVALALVVALIVAFLRIREQRGWRFGAIAAALAIAASYTLLMRTGDPQVDAVERFHFVEYGLVTLLFYRAWRPAADLSMLVLPVLAALVVGTLEEWFQWFIPARVGEVKDVFLNGVAIACGLIFSVALDPPARPAVLTSAAIRRIGLGAAALVVVFGAFFQSVHLGYEIIADRSGESWRFRSGYRATELESLAADRANRWRGVTVGRPPRLSAEDQYMTEGHWHVAARNSAWAANDVVGAWNENLILERYFGPVLGTPSYLSPTGHRWNVEHVVDAARRLPAVAARPEYRSRAEPSPIYVWPKGIYWTVIAVLAALLAAPWIVNRAQRRSPPAAEHHVLG